MRAYLLRNVYGSWDNVNSLQGTVATHFALSEYDVAFICICLSFLVSLFFLLCKWKGSVSHVTKGTNFTRQNLRI